MKKLIAVVTMLLAFSISANAQDKKAAVEAAAQKDVAALIEKVTIDQSLKQDMYTLMVMKHEQLAQAKTQADKNKVYAAMEQKIMSGMDKEQQKILSNNPALLKQLTH
ncbi:hypothetical protein [Flavobacterium sp.]|uniref:hypothetical protein n=1 Tax=Flavobacterium sp. TaxID=239 RepID=UPI0039E6F5E3